MSDAGQDPSLVPWLFVIIGTTGSGKTKLSIELAEALARNLQLRVEVVSADSMQLYKHIDVLSAKASLEEQARVKHHLLDIADVDDEHFCVQEYQKLAKETIQILLDAHAVPILVGGTNYYIESVIWDSKYSFTMGDSAIDPALKAELEALDDRALHARLALVDAPRAELLHPNVRRKVMRSLEIYYSSNKRHSDWLREQQEKAKFAWERTCFFWVSCSSEVLETRLSARVDDMVSLGLKDELKLVANLFKTKQKPMNWTRGALQSIGLREFKAWIENFQTTGADDETIFSDAVEQVKLHTRQYAKAQISWIKNGLLPSATVYRLDSSDTKHWNDFVLNPAIMVASMLMQARTREEVSAALQASHPAVDCLIPSAPSSFKSDNAWKKYQCEYCNRTLNGDAEWSAHQKARAHKAAKSKFFKAQRASSATSSKFNDG